MCLHELTAKNFWLLKICSFWRGVVLELVTSFLSNKGGKNQFRIRSLLNDSYVKQKNENVVQHIGRIAATLYGKFPLSKTFAVSGKKRNNWINFSSLSQDTYLPSKLPCSPKSFSFLENSLLMTPSTHFPIHLPRICTLALIIPGPWYSQLTSS